MTHPLAAGDHTPQIPAPPGAIRVRSPQDLLALIPHLMGFVPDASVVVIGLVPPRDRIKITLRYDLPDPPDADRADDLAAHVAGVLGSQQLTTATAVGYGPGTLVTPVAEAIRDTLWAEGIDLWDFLRVEDGRYWSYCCREVACCPAEGVPLRPDPRTSAHLARAGAGVLPDRAAVAARVAPVQGPEAETMRRATRRADQRARQLTRRVHKPSRLAAVRRTITAEGLHAVQELIGAYRAGRRYDRLDQVARLTVALRELRVRDDAWTRMDPAHAAAHLQLWLDVTRLAQPGYAAAPASLLAFVAWQEGDGALANVALDRALADDSRYSMGLLLREIITAGTPPSRARLSLTPEQVAASYDDAEAAFGPPGAPGPEEEDRYEALLDDEADESCDGDDPGGPGYTA